MKLQDLFSIALSVVLFGQVYAADPVVSDLTAAQRPGTRLVDITYNVTADTPTVKVSLEASIDGGTTWSVPVTATSGDIGAGIAVGTGKTIVWDAGVDWNNKYSAQTRYRVTADDGVPTVPPGFSLIPASSFTMGDSVDGNPYENAPPVTVNVSAFYMAKHEVTKALWDEVRTWGLANGYTDLPAGGGKAANHPVHSINWYAMVKWCNARSEQEGLTPCYSVSGATYKTGSSDAVVCNWTGNGYRLPTEAEWEKAARGGVSGKRFPWGTDTITHNEANYKSSTSYSYDTSSTRGNHPTYNDGTTPYTSPVGSFTANGYGLHDMAGNVWERCWDWYSVSTYTNGASDPRGAPSGEDRVFRGGSWFNDAYYCCTALRNYYPPGNSYDHFGFRVARSIVGMSLIPEGPFTMGDSLDGSANAPTWTVTLSAFYMGQFEATKAEWDVVRTWAISRGYTDLAVGVGKAPDHPVHTITWYDTVKWCNARSEKEGLTPCYTTGGITYKTGSSDAVVCNWTGNGYRLPTEAEWEKAARGGLSGKRFPWGDTISHDQANYYSSTNSGFDISPTQGYHPGYSNGDFSTQGYTSPVGAFLPNGYGLFDITGNVRERCWDRYSASAYSGNDFDPTGPVTGTERVVRGGGWSYYANASTIAYRNFYSPTGTSFSNGFRVARSACSLGRTGFAETADVVVDTRDKVTLLTTASQGTVTGAGDYTPGSTATLTAIPIPGYAFTGWTGNASGTVNPLNILMDGNKTVGATFTPDLSDTDGDNLNAYLELVIYGTDLTKGDTDGDGLSDAWEVGHGRFTIVPGNFTWAQARTDAKVKGGDLACFPDEHRWNRAMETLGPNALDDYTGLWLGASDAATDGTWTWVNGEAFTFQLWATGRPSATPGNTLDYLEVSGGAGAEIAKWYDRSPTTVRDGYILETGYATSPTDPDSDNDGLNDGQEQAAGTNPFVGDTDGDGLTDPQEVNLTHTNPKLADTDGDGTNDAADDEDGDTLTNLAEITQHGTDPLKADTDNDGLTDSAELSHPASYFALVSGTFTYVQAAADAAAKRGRIASFPNSSDFTRMANKARQTTQGYHWIGLSDAAAEGTWLWTDGSAATYQRWLNGQPDGNTAENHAVIMENTTQWADAAADFAAAGYLFERIGLDPLTADTDGDGLTDGREVDTVQSNPVLDDTDGDGLTDGAEVNTHGSSPLLTDTDSDTLSDRAEVEIHHSNPALKDTDGDGFDDAFEVNTGFDPTKDTSTPDALSSIRTAVEFRFNAANGVSYRIEDSTDLNEWNTVEPDIVGTGGVITRFYSTENQPKRYFRVRRN